MFFARERDNVSVEVCFQYNDGYSENLLSFVNNINTIEGGTHVGGFRAALTRTLNTHALAGGMLKSTDDALSGEDVREGLIAVVSVRLTNPQFEGQTKTKLGNSEVKGVVEAMVNETLGAYLEENPPVTRRIIDKALNAARAREAARKARELTRRKVVNIGGLWRVIKQGNVFWVDLDDPSGSGPGYRHPHVVIQNNLFNRSRINTVVVCALTSNLKRALAQGMFC